MKHPLQDAAQRPDEERVMVIRRHGFVFFRRVIFLLVLIAIPPIFLFALIPPAWGLILEQSPGGVLLVMGFSVYYLYLGLYFLHSWVDYYLDVWILSTKRIVNIEQRGLFSRVVSELLLDKVQDVTVEVHGVIPTMFHFGDIMIQTAGESPRFHFDDVPWPHKVAEKIMELHRAYANTPPPARVAQNNTEDLVPTFHASGDSHDAPSQSTNRETPR